MSASFTCPLCKIGSVVKGTCLNCQAQFCPDCHGTITPGIKSVPRCATKGHCSKAKITLNVAPPKPR